MAATDAARALYTLVAMARRYQYLAARDAIAKKRSIVTIPTGGGKTLVGAMWLLYHLATRPGLGLVAVPTRALRDQWIDFFNWLNGASGASLRICDDYSPGCDIVVATYQKAEQILREKPVSNIYVVIDEAHHVRPDSFASLAKALREATAVLGLTAMPREWLQRHGYPEDMYIISDYYTTTAGYVYKPGVSIVEVNPEERIAATADVAWKLASSGKKVIVYMPFIETAEEVAKLLKERGVKVAKLYGVSRMSDKVRRENLEMFRRGEARVLVVTQAGLEGIDIPDADAAVIPATRSLRVMLQFLGRITRPGAAKQPAFVVVATPDTMPAVTMLASKLVEMGLARVEEPVQPMYAPKPNVEALPFSPSPDEAPRLAQLLMSVKKPGPRDYEVMTKFLLGWYRVHRPESWRTSAARDVARMSNAVAEPPRDAVSVKWWWTNPARLDMRLVDDSSAEAKRRFKKLLESVEPQPA